MLVSFLAALLACSSGGPGDLKPASALNQACYGWPDQEFKKGQDLPTAKDTRLQTGDAAVDFTLKDVNGKSFRLADLLTDKPVLLVAGSYTCNVFQKKVAGVRALHKKFGNDVNVVVVYNIEAHPKGDPSPYRGRPWPLEYSDRGQADTYADRVKNARDIDAGGALVLVDALEEGNANPFWCTYGSCPNCAFLVNQQGRLEAVHTWFDKKTMTGSIQSMLSREKAR